MGGDRRDGPGYGPGDPEDCGHKVGVPYPWIEATANIWFINSTRSLPGGNARDMDVLRGHVLFVPRKAIVKADDFMEQYVRELLPAAPSTTVLFTPGIPAISGNNANNAAP